MTGQQNRWFLLLILALAIVSGVITFRNKIGNFDVSPKMGLDIKGGVRVVLRAKTSEYTGNWNAENLEAVRKVLENRVNATGVAEPLLITKPPDQIIVELPGLKDEKQALEQLQSTASLEFYWLPQLGNSKTGRKGTWDQRSSKDPKAVGDELYNVETGQALTPQQLEEAIFGNKEFKEGGPDSPSHLIATGKDLENTCRATIGADGKAEIQFEFKTSGNEKGGQNFEEFTRNHTGEFLAVFLDKKLLTAPTVEGVIPGGKGVIHGSFSLEYAKAVADQLNAGALPVPLETIEVRKLEATLGAEAVRQTTVAGIIGLALVVLLMLVWYRLPGLIANVALILYALFSIALFKLIPITLTLPGIAGFILSIGMAVDANILIFERMKEELRSGKTLRNAIDTGFKRAFTAIFDSNFCTIMTCCVLYGFGTGSIRGFALTLGVGVAVSMFTAITVTRTFLFSLVSLGGFAANPAAYGLSERHYDLKVMSRKMLWLGISGAIIVPGLIAWAIGGIKPSIDFTGGTELQIPFAAHHSPIEIEKALTEINGTYKNTSRVVVSSFGGDNVAYVTIPRLSVGDRETVTQSLVSKVGPLGNGQSVGYSDVSGTISAELTRDAILAVIVASGLIVLYLTFRFAIGGWREGLKYGSCAVIALLHDVLVVWGLFAILGFALNWQVDSLFVTAMLTVIGFSVHDTIIVFDRVRENLQHRQRGENFSDLTDRSIDQTFSRSLRTSFTVIVTLLALFLFGGSIINHFVGALLFGIISGTYSSIFNASVLLVLWKQRDGTLTLAGAGAATGPKSNLAARPTTALPGDKPLVTPAPKPERPRPTLDADVSGAVERATSEGERSETSRTAAPRKQPVRRRRM